MPFNLYTFFLAEKFNNEEFNKRNVPNPDSARRTALIASFLGPADGGGINAAVFPAIISREAARREAEAAEAQHLSEIQQSLVPYPNVVKQTVQAASAELSKNFSVKVIDGNGKSLDPDKVPTVRVVAQSPDPTTTTALAKGSAVTLTVTPPTD